MSIGTWVVLTVDSGQIAVMLVILHVAGMNEPCARTIITMVVMMQKANLILVRLILIRSQDMSLTCT